MVEPALTVPEALRADVQADGPDLTVQLVGPCFYLKALVATKFIVSVIVINKTEF